MKARLTRYGSLALIVGGIAVVFRGWLASGVITYGDWAFYSDGRMRDFWPIPSLWDGSVVTGYTNLLAGPMFPVLFLHGLLNQLGIDFALSERLIWIFPSVLIAAFSTYGLAVSFFSSRVAGVISALLAVFNSYITVIMTGGQFSVSVGYALTSLALLLFYRALRQHSVSRLAQTGLCIAIQIMYDLRSTYLTLGMLCLFGLYYCIAQRRAGQMARTAGWIVLQFAMIALVTLLVHIFWLLPAHYAAKVALPAGYNSTNWVHALSYMQLSHAFALLHPFWYQNTFSPTVDAVTPLFWLLPLAIFATLLRRRLSYIELFLFSMALLAIFLVKGSNVPGGVVYDWVFNHVPGFSMYRDPSKLFQPLALAYALLLGRAASLHPTFLTGRWAMHSRIIVRGLIVLACTGLVMVQALPVAANTSWGTLAPQQIPAEYVAFNHYIDQQSQFFRILWYPLFYPYATYSSLHPSIGADYVGQTYLSNQLPVSGDTTSWLRLPQAASYLSALSVKYIVIPDYPSGTATYRATQNRDIRLLRRTFPSFRNIRFGKINLFVNPTHLPAIFVPQRSVTPATIGKQRQGATTESGNGGTSNKLGKYPVGCHGCLIIASQSRTRYEVIVRDVSRPFLLVLNQAFDPNWVAYVEPSTAPQSPWWTWTHAAVPKRDHLIANGFANAWWIDARGTHRIVVEFWPQRFVNAGWFLTWATILGILASAAVPPFAKYLRRTSSRDTDSEPDRLVDEPKVKKVAV